MYEELIKRLRNCTSDTVEDCAECPYQGGYKGTYCMNGLIEEAADVIEEEDMNFRHLERDYKELCAYLPKWIPVTDRLPEKPYGCMVIVWDNPYGSGDPFLNYYPEYIGFDGESWNDGDGEKIPFEVVYWMKMPEIPEPPKEE